MENLGKSRSVGESQLQKVIRDMQESVEGLCKEFQEHGEPITDDSGNLHTFCAKLEYLLQFDQKEKNTLLGHRKDYWDYFSDCLGRQKGHNDGIRFVKSISELKTSLGKGRAFIRYCLVHRRLADTFQQCLINHKTTSDWYYVRSPFFKKDLNSSIIESLYELNEIHFDLAPRGHDLDADWPVFARRSLGFSPTHNWKPPSRSSSMNSLASNISQVMDISIGPEMMDSESEAQLESLRLELDRSEMRKREMEARIQRMETERHQQIEAQVAMTGIQKHGEELRSTGEELRSARAELNKERAELQTEREELCKEREELRREREVVRGEREQQCADKEQLNKEKEALLIRQEELKRENEVLAQRVSILESEMNSNQTEGTPDPSAKSDVSSAELVEEYFKKEQILQENIFHLENTNKKHLERVAELSRSLQESHDAAIHTTAQLSESQAKLRSIEEANDSLASWLSTALGDDMDGKALDASHPESLQQKVESILKQLQKIRQREMDLNKVAKENQTLVKQLSEQVSERESVLFELQTRAEKEYKKHQTEISRLHQEKLDMERKCKYQEEEREKAVSQLGELGTLKEIGEKNNVAFENDKRHLLAKVDELEADVQVIKEREKFLRDETDRLRDQIEQQTLKITMMEKRNLEGTETLNKENQIVRENGLKVKERLEAELQALNAVLADKEDALANAAREREVFCSSAGELAAEKSALAERVQIMEQQVVTAQEETMALQKKMAKEVQSLEDRAREQAGIMAERGDAISILKSNLATLQETEKLLQSQVEDAKLSLGEKEQKLREENKDLSERLKDVLWQHEAFIENITSLQLERVVLSKQLVAQEESFATLQLNVQKAESLNSEYEKQLMNLREEEAKYKLLLENVNAALLEKENELQTVNREFTVEKKTLNMELEQQKQAVSALTEENEVLTKCCTELKTVSSKEAEELMWKLASLEEQLEEKQRDFSGILEKMTSLEGVPVDNSTKLDLEIKLSSAVEEQSQAIDQKLAHMTRSNLQLQEQVKSLERDNNILIKEKKKVEEQSLALEEAMSKLAQQVELLNQDSAAVKSMLEKARANEKELETKVQTLIAEKEELKGSLSTQSCEASERLRLAEQERFALCQERQELHGKCGTLEAELKTVTESLQQANEHLHSAQESLQQHQQQVDIAKAGLEDHEARLESYSKEVESLKAQLSEKETHITSLDSRVQDLLAQHEELRVLNTHQAEQVKQQQTALAEREKKLQALSQSLENMMKTQNSEQEAWQERYESLRCEREQVESVSISTLQDQRAQAEQREQSLQAEVVTQQDTVAQLKEKLVELLRDKDTLWKKTDQLEAEKQQYFWQPDHNTKKCTSCKMEFGILTRKHHCRSCGLIFCSNCCSNWVGKNRNCRPCYVTNSNLSPTSNADGQARAGDGPRTPKSSSQTSGVSQCDETFEVINANISSDDLSS
uniref:FYVE and coiled-coil domain-containing protein 1-like isoform X1 n=1 Tax=Petromyzon marinus TaxID=7757 RepID=A0AAJ7SNS7_PETMA|nr:FYVE and coiled-coil domain-containing protein 1-like isoform X1 [Petromyzon marinus]XP_032801780.1 FYVE and coiled-coil domain-containing protein 1-like isoform X1 [Petromyzon marinus]XP_032801781.1 FYVE and coiled-coil domain-containing protein 1-like isoform X1 [Petromyzon marinus]XP_032801782.1 FYVE and coiled-coil domain-containing protein 1-like isoform X1 [Petromyzon marinus]XP_032801783.1 FYVE and coiled-coil domain-containing protein 1-like isoform X1 [Petromyzon marinus]XP_0328017